MKKKTQEQEKCGRGCQKVWNAFTSDAGNDKLDEDRCEESAESQNGLCQRVTFPCNDSSTTNIVDTLHHAALLEQECKILDAATLLEGIDPIYFKSEHRSIVKEAGVLKRVLRDCKSNATLRDDWLKLGEQHGKHDISMEYKVNPTSKMYTYRIVTPLEASMVVPVLSVFNESELYSSWIPQSRFPKFRFSKTDKLVQLGRASQIILLEVEHPWPIAKREVILKAIACDDIAKVGRILVSIQSMDNENNGDYGLTILPAKKPRGSLNGGMVFEKCPLDHPMRKTHVSNEDDLVLLTLTFSMKITEKSFLPMWLLNFILTFFFPRAFSMLLQVGEEVKDGKRPVFSEVIQRKREDLYDWLDERVSALFTQKKERPAKHSGTTQYGATCLSLGSGTFSDAGINFEDLR